MNGLWDAALNYDAVSVRVLCDWLIEQGDERGEVIAVLTAEGFEMANGALEPGFSAVLREKRASTEHGTVGRLNGWFRRVYAADMERILPRTHPRYGQRSWTWESDRAFVEAPESYHFPVQDSVTPENGFRYAGAGIEVGPSPFVPEGQAYLMQREVVSREALRRRMYDAGSIDVGGMLPGDSVQINGVTLTASAIDEHADHVASHAAALAAAINASPAGVDAREVDGRIVLGRPAGRISMVEHMLEHSLIYGAGAVRLTWDDPVPPFRVAARPIGRQFERPIVIEPPPKHRRGPSRLPPFIPQRRLDGRRAR